AQIRQLPDILTALPRPVCHATIITGGEVDRPRQGASSAARPRACDLGLGCSAEGSTADQRRHGYPVAVGRLADLALLVRIHPCGEHDVPAALLRLWLFVLLWVMRSHAYRLPDLTD